MVDDAVWEPVPGFPGYERTRFGEFRSWRCGRGRRKTPRAVKPCPTKGYLRVGLVRDGKQYWIGVAETVLEMNVGPRPEGLQVCHFPDRNTANNHPDNLRWGTPLENSADKRIHGTMAKGQTHGSQTKPERTARGDRHGRQTKPERTARGEKNGAHTMPHRRSRSPGESHGRHKLTETQVARILTEAGPAPRARGTLTRLAREHGVTTSAVWMIVKGLKWKHHANSPTALKTIDPGGTSLSDVCGP
jgi:hypothetical protein